MEMNCGGEANLELDNLEIAGCCGTGDTQFLSSAQRIETGTESSQV